MHPRSTIRDSNPCLLKNPFCTYFLSLETYFSVVIPASKPVQLLVCNCENADCTTLKFELADVEWVCTLRKLNSDDAVDWLASTVLRIVDDCIPSKRSLLNMFRTREQITNVIAHSVEKNGCTRRLV